MRALFLCFALALVLVPGCGGDDRSVCERAQGALDACDAANEAQSTMLGYRRIPLVFTGQCSGIAVCTAACVNASSCPAITYAELGGQTDPNSSAPPGASTFIGCVNTCIDER